MSSYAKLGPTGGRIDGPDGVIRIAVPTTVESPKVAARRLAVSAYGRNGIRAIGRVPEPKSAKVGGVPVLVFDFTPVTVTKANTAPSGRFSENAKAKGKGKGKGKATAKADAAKAERTPGRWSGVTCRTCRDFGYVKRTANAAGRVTYRSAKGAAESVEDGRGVACPDHVKGTDAHAKATRQAVKSARATYAAQKRAAEAATA